MAKKSTSKKISSVIRYRIRYRSANTGRFVSQKYATKHPRTTIKEVTRKPGTNDGGTIGGGARRK